MALGKFGLQFLEGIPSSVMSFCRANYEVPEAITNSLFAGNEDEKPTVEVIARRGDESLAERILTEAGR